MMGMDGEKARELENTQKQGTISRSVKNEIKILRKMSSSSAVGVILLHPVRTYSSGMVLSGFLFLLQLILKFY